MKKFFLFLSLLLLPFIVKAQVRTFSIDWDNQSSSLSEAPSETNYLTYKEKAFSKLNLQLTDRTLQYSEQWEDNGFADPSSLRVSNIVYASLSAEELAKVNSALVPAAPEYFIRSKKARNITYTILSISPVVNVNGVLRKIVSFSADYRKTNAKNTQNRIQLSNSVLASGAWYKFKVEKTGIHKIDKSFLNDLGMNTDGINPRNLKIYGHGGKPLPFLNSLNTDFDLPENSIQVIGEEDGSFDAGDAILFYGISTQGYDDTVDDFRDLSATGQLNDTNINPYSDEAYYYVTVEGGAGLRVQPMVEPVGAGVPITQFHDYKFHELDESSPGLVGRRWYGNRFDIESEQTFEFDFPNIVSNGDPMFVVVKAGATSESVTSMALSVNGTSLDPLNFAGLSGQSVLSVDDFRGEVPASGSSTVTVDLAYNNGGNPSSIGYLDYIGIEALRQLTGVEGQLPFKYNGVTAMTGVGEYQISNASQFTQVWDVTNTNQITAKQNEASESTFTFKAQMGLLRKYVAVHPNDYYAPVRIANSQVVNQDLKGTIFNDETGSFKDIDYLIITAPYLIQPALKLANHHKNVSGLTTKVVTTDMIYEEFSSGQQDIGGIRNFIRYVYENASSEENRVKYLCFFGDTSVDYKNRISNNNNVVPSFHTVASVSNHYSYVSDDYFGMMDEDEGTMSADDLLDIAVGRILTDEVTHANAMVQKIIDYSLKESYGNWRNNFLLISDDVDNGDQILEIELDALGDVISEQKPFVNVKKIHSDAFQQETSAGGNRYPAVNEAIKNNIELGALIIDYFGHGGEDGLASEFIYTKEAAQNLQNKQKYPCIITVTCEFTKFDNPLRVTAGELTYQNKEGGAISLVTTTRSINISLGIDYNEALASELYGFGVENPNTPAEGLRLSKNNINSVERRVVFFIGDPALPLAFPKKDIRITTLNGVPISQATDTLKALSKVRFEGEVTNQNGQKLTGYNGVLEAKLFDKNVNRQTLGNDRASNSGYILDFVTLGEVLFNGQATITNGDFAFEFVMPRDTQIPVGNGRVSLYAKRDNVLQDQGGVNVDIKVGGLNENAPEDDRGPLISLFMNDESFISGGITNDSPVLLAKIEDANGINTSSGVGHDIVAVLDGDESNPYVVNEYYQADVDDFTKGTLNYKLRDLEDGLHTLTLKAWDVYNNSSTEEIQFIVAGDDALEITNVLNYPNPFVNYTEFWFNHNRPYEPLEVQVQVFTVTGKVVWTQNQIVTTDGFLSREITWDGTDDFGDRIGKGVYVYKITVKSTLTNKQVEKFEKLVIL